MRAPCPLIEHAREPPVEHVDLAEVAEHDVRRLEIAMDDAARVGELDREADVDEPREDLAAWPLLAHGLLLRAIREHIGERRAGQSLHHEVRVAVPIDAEIVDRHDRRMLEPTLDVRLAKESRDRFRVAPLGEQDLHRDLAIDARVVREPYLAHAAAANLGAELVALVFAGRRDRDRHRPGRAVSERPLGIGFVVGHARPAYSIAVTILDRDDWRTCQNDYMWSLLLCLLLGGCGRLDFDSIAGATTSGDGGTGDAGTGDGGAVALTGVYLISGDGSGPTAVLALDLATGDVATVGTIASSFGLLQALAYWDANTLYAAGSGHLVEITLSPFSATDVGAITTDEIVGMMTEGTELTMVDRTTSQLMIIDPAALGSQPTTKALGLPIDGGDIAGASFGGSYYFSNSGAELYAVYTATGNSMPTLNAPSVGTIEGVISQNTYAQYYMTSSTLDAVIPLDVTTATLGTAIPLCHPCPGTPYDLLTGDAASAP